MVNIHLKYSGPQQKVNPRYWLFPACWILLTCWATSGIGQTDVVIERGLRHTDFDQVTVATAVERTNQLLMDTGIRLLPSWLEPTDQAPALNTVPVYLVATRESDASTPAAVPKGCRCVFVNPAVLATWVANNSLGPGRMTLDRGYFLTFVLLHEVGHILKGTPAVAFENGQLSQLNVAPSKAKANEEDADEFAAALLHQYSRRTPANNASLEANLVVNELAKLSWNMQAYRTLDEFGAFAMGKPGVFFDNGYSHPNLAWRILRTNNLIERSEVTQQLLDVFEEARQRGPSSPP